MSNMEKVLVLQGGVSSEREVSLRSAANVIHWLKETGYEVVVADPADTDFELTKAAADCDAVLPILHGAGGEDGVLQLGLEELAKPFLGSGSKACALTFDKQHFRDFMIKRGVQMPRGETVNEAGFRSSELRQAPYVLKPINGGSSVDTLILHDISKEPDDAYFDRLFGRHQEMLLEELIVGQELTVGVLADKALPIILVIPPEGEEFDYENKYNGRSQEIVNPEQIAPKIQQEAKDLALHVHQLAGCRHLSRTDMIATPSGELYVLELNTIPGLTEESLLPKMAAADGVDMAALVTRFVAMANGL